MNSVKSLTILLCVAIMSASMCSCKSPSTDSSSEINSFSETTMAPVESTSESETSTTESSQEESVSVGFEQYVGETLPTIEYDIPEDLTEFSIKMQTHAIRFGGREFGMDNPLLTEKVRDYFGNSELTFYDLGYLQEAYSFIDYGGHFPFKEYQEFVGQNIHCQIAMYIVEKLGRRLYVDEIPYEFFEENFSDYLYIIDYSNLDEFLSKYDNVIFDVDAVFLHVPSEELRNVNLSKDINEIIGKLGSDFDKEVLRLIIFEAAFTYNQTRCEIAYDYHGYHDESKDWNGDGVFGDFKASYVKQVRTVDGKNVLIFNQHQYDEFIKDMHDQECYQNITDLYAPLTEQDLIDAGIDLDKFKYVIEDLAGIIL